MKFDEVKERYVYYVNFNPFRKGEFNDNHLSVVLRKNNDKKTMIVIPLTSKENGVGNNKILIDIPDLPERLKKDNQKSYAVYNQVRTVNSGRLQPIYKNKDHIEIIDVKVQNYVFMDLIKMATLELEQKLTLDEKIELNSNKLNDLYMEKIVNLAYKIKKSKEDIDRIRIELEGILYNNKIEYKFTDKDKENGIENIIRDILEKKISK